MAVATRLSVPGNVLGEVNKAVGSDADARPKEVVIDEEYVADEDDFADETSQSPKSERHPSPQNFRPELQYSY